MRTSLGLEARGGGVGGTHTFQPLLGIAIKCLIDLQLRLEGLEELLFLFALLLQEGQLAL